MPLIARQRSRLAVLAVLALVGSLLAVSAVPVAADYNKDDDTADAKAMYSACVGAATEDAGFTDMGNSFAADAANCLVHYGISGGTGDGSTFSPDRGVSRLQMARFLSRAAGPAGIDTMMVEAQGLTDIGDLSDEAQDAVNTVVHLGIMTAHADDTFDPSGAVSRRDMAVHIAAFLSAALTGPGGTDIDKLKNGHASGATPFTDIDGVSVSAHKAIRDIFELGVTTGTTATTFGPNDPVSRAQMAAFISRALAHTNARPTGLTVQAAKLNVFTGESADFTASVRDDDHQPVAEALVDMIVFDHDDDDEAAFGDDGACSDDVRAASGCEITGGEEALTDNDGNSLDDELEVLAGADDMTVWFWTGDLNDEFDADETDSVRIEIAVSPAAAAVQLVASHNNSTNKAKLGEEATVTVQLIDGDNDPVAESGKAVSVTISTTDANGVTTSSTKDHKTDDSGTIEIPLTFNDPDSGEDNTATATVTITNADEDAPVGRFEDADNAEMELVALDDDGQTDDNQAIFMIEWSDAKPVATSLSLKSSHDYVMIPTITGSGTKNVVVTLTPTVMDQYGDRMAGLRARLVTDAGATDGTAHGTFSAEKPRSRFTVTKTVSASLLSISQNFGAYYTVIAPATTDDTDTTVDETQGVYVGAGVTAVDGERSATNPPTLATADPGLASVVVVHWAQALEDDQATATNVLYVDKDANVIVIEVSGVPRYVEYDANDQFNVGASGNETAKTLEEFVKALPAGKGSGQLAYVHAEGDGEGGVNTFTYNPAT